MSERREGMEELKKEMTEANTQLALMNQKMDYFLEKLNNHAIKLNECDMFINGEKDLPGARAMLHNLREEQKFHRSISITAISGSILVILGEVVKFFTEKHG